MQWRDVFCDVSIDLALNLWKRIDSRVCNEHLYNRFFTSAFNGEISKIDHSRPATPCMVEIAVHLSIYGKLFITQDVICGKKCHSNQWFLCKFRKYAVGIMISNVNTRIQLRALRLVPMVEKQNSSYSDHNGVRRFAD